jgi:hypothetical protein
MSQATLKISPSRQVFILGLVLLFVGSFSALGILGLKLADKDAGILSRLHPTFYLIIPFLFLQFITHGKMRGNAAWEHDGVLAPNQRSLRRAYIAHAGIVVVAIAASILGITHGSIANSVTTFLLPVFCYAGINRLSPADLRTIRNALLIFMLVNSLLGIAEKAFEFRLFAYTVGLNEKLNDPRPTAWLSHPLNNALLTALVLTYLMYSKRTIAFRIPMIAVHGFALICFGGRTAIVALLALLALDYCLSWARAATGRNALPLVGKTLALLIAAGAIAVMINLGYLDDLIRRFSEDSGSASVRWQTLDLINGVDFRSIPLGISNEGLEQALSYYGIYNIEFSWLSLILMHGLVLGSALVASLVFLLLRLGWSLGRPASYMAVLFVVVTFGYTSIGSSSLLIAQLLVLMAAFQETNFTHIRRTN